MKQKLMNITYNTIVCLSVVLFLFFIAKQVYIHNVHETQTLTVTEKSEQTHSGVKGRYTNYHIETKELGRLSVPKKEYKKIETGNTYKKEVNLLFKIIVSK